MNWPIFEHEYLRHAILAGACAGIACGVVGVFVVTMHLAFLGVCIAHAAFAGALLGVWLGFDPMIGALAFSVGAAAVIGPLADRGDLAPDTSVGIVFSLMLGLAFLFLGMAGSSRANVIGLLSGSILTVTRQDLAFLAGTAGCIVLLVVLFYKEIHAVVCHRHVALAVGIPATAVFYAILFATGVTIAVSLQSVGGMLIFSLVLCPAAAALQLTYRFTWLLVLASVFGVLSCWAGLAASYLWDLNAGAAIVITASVLFAVASIFSPKRRAKPRKARPSHGV